MGGFPTNVEYFEIDKTRSFKRTFNGGHCCKTRNVRVVSLSVRSTQQTGCWHLETIINLNYNSHN